MFITFHQKQKFRASIEWKDTQQAKPTTDELPDDGTKTAIFLKENLAIYKLNNKDKKLKTKIIDKIQ